MLRGLGHGLAEGWWMFFDTFWALVLGFALSGAVQAFVSRREMRTVLGDHRPRTLVRAGFFGIVSSSCSYAASALAKSLFARGADFTASMVFMVASTNLVVELGIVLWLLLGWQFAAAEFVGGALMITVLGFVLPRAVPAQWIDDARKRLTQEPPTADGAAVSELPWPQRLRSRAGWSAASGYAIGDLTMLRKELVAGFAVAGFTSALVPTWCWRALFSTGHGAWSSVQNAILGPFLALISFVCSVGNVPLAAALWHGGISFGGVIAFVFADLITVPLLFIYRRYFGLRLTLRLLGVFWVTMSAAGLVTEYLFRVLRVAPSHGPHTFAVTQIGSNPTTILDLVAAIGLGGLYLLYRGTRTASDDGTSRYAVDVSCGMQVEKAAAAASRMVGGKTYFFCSDRCAEAFATSAAHPAN